MRSGRRKIPKKVLEEVLERSGGLCEAVNEMGVRCCKFDGWRRAPHHIKKRSQGGPDTAENLLWVCGRDHSLEEGIKEV